MDKKYNAEVDGPVVTMTGLKAYNVKLNEKLDDLTQKYNSLKEELDNLKSQVGGQS